MKLAALIGLVAFLNLFFFHRIGSTGLVLVIFGLFLFIKIILGGLKFKKNDLNWLLICGLPTLLLLTRAYPFIIFLLIVLILFTLSSYAYLSLYGLAFFPSWLATLLFPLKLAKEYFVSIAETIFFSGKFHKDSKVIVGGLIIAAPVLLVLISLLAAADPIYGKFIYEIINIRLNLNSIIWQRIVLSAIIFAIFLPFIFFRKRNYQPADFPSFHKYSFASEMGIAIVTVAVVLGSFLIVQYPYIFASVPKETSLIRFGVQTYSEYVRRGFIELIMAAVIIYGTVLSGLVVWRTSKKNSRNFLKYSQLLLLFELFIFIISLFRRIWLYQAYHGWSLVRIYGGVFLLYLSFLTVTLTLRHFITRRWVFVEISAAYLLIISLGIFNTERFIATSSHPPTVNGRIDYVYLSRLSPDGYEGWRKAYGYAKNVLLDSKLDEKAVINMEERREIAYAGMIAENLSRNYQEVNNYQDKLYVWNYSKESAFKEIQKDFGYENLLKLQEEYQKLMGKIQKQPENERTYEMDISLKSPLLD